MTTPREAASEHEPEADDSPSAEGTAADRNALRRARDEAKRWRAEYRAERAENRIKRADLRAELAACQTELGASRNKLWNVERAATDWRKLARLLALALADTRPEKPEALRLIDRALYVKGGKSTRAQLATRERMRQRRLREAS